MNGQMTQYRGAVRRNLHCGANTKNRLLAKLDRLLDAYAEEHDEASAEALIAAFGAPEEMANILMHDVTPGEMEQYRRQSVVKKNILCVLLAVFIAFTVWLYFFKEVGITSYDSGRIVDRTAESTSSTIHGDE